MSASPAADSVARRRHLLLCAAALWGPAVLGFFSGCSHCREAWPRLFPAAPGYLPLAAATSALTGSRAGPVLEWSLAMLFTLALFGGLFVLGRARRPVRVAALLVGAAWSLVASGALMAALAM